MIEHDDLDIDHDIQLTESEARYIFNKLTSAYRSEHYNFWLKSEMFFIEWLKKYSNENKITITVDDLVDVLNKSKEIIDILEKI